uniref:C2H2-type domain-containing protein n=1 Tax=Xiphophorus couchianus TaxID=32473 RepID=A0A3B5M1P3_9TELE
MENGRESKVVCQVCGVWYRTISGLTRHFKCSHCSKTFAVQSALNVHLWIHVEDRPHKCDLCPKTFGLRGQLTAHKKSHVSRDRYLCNICGRSVSDLRSLTRHKLTHSNERHYGCKVCGKRFKLEHTLKEHMKVHTTRDRMFLCHICCKTFLSNNALTVHTVTFLGKLTGFLWFCFLFSVLFLYRPVSIKH